MHGNTLLQMVIDLLRQIPIEPKCLRRGRCTNRKSGRPKPPRCRTVCPIDARPRRKSGVIHDLPVIAENTYQLWLWLDARVTDFPRAARASLDLRLNDCACQSLESVTNAVYAASASGRTSDLRKANQKAAVLRLYLRGAVERRYLSSGQGEHAQRELAAIGKMVGGWLRSTRERRPNPAK